MDDPEACLVGACDAGSGACVVEPAEDGSPCEDGDLCTLDDSCNSGSCEGGRAKSCDNDEADPSACRAPGCDSDTGECVQQELPDDTPCDDLDPCTQGDRCVLGLCRGTALDCDAAVGPCNVGRCDVGTGECVGTPRAEGADCEHPDPCVESGACAMGECLPATRKDCSAEAGACQIGRCDSESGDCVSEPVEDGTTCDDGNLCTLGDRCMAGACAAGRERSCPARDDTCVSGPGGCLPETGECDYTFPVEGFPCEHPNPCVTAAGCSGGICEAFQERDCSHLETGDPCENVFCEFEGPDGEPSGACVRRVAFGAPCDDGDSCTEQDRCGAEFSCAGRAVDCSALDADCRVGVCDADDGCVAEAANEGGVCDDGDLCSLGEACSEGVCAGGADVDCSGFNAACSVGVCDAMTGNCGVAPVADGTACDDGDAGTVGDLCEGGSCLGCLLDAADPGDDSAGGAAMLGSGERSRRRLCQGDSDWFSIEVPAEGTWHLGARLHDGRHGCPAGGALGLEVVGADGTTVVATSEPAQGCPALGPVAEAALRDVAAGTWYARAYARDANAGDYVAELALIHDEAEPNDSIAMRQAAPGEVYWIYGQIDAPGDIDYFGLQLPEGLQSSIEAITGEFGCPTDTVLAYAGDGFEITENDDAGAVGVCSHLDPLVDFKVRNLAPGTSSGNFGLRLVGASALSTTGPYTLGVRIHRSADGPDNDTPATARPLPAQADYVQYMINDAADIDVWSIDVPEGASIRAGTWRPDGYCKERFPGLQDVMIDTRLELLDPNGTRVRAQNDEYFLGAPCAGIYGPWAQGSRDLPAGTYFLRVSRQSSARNTAGAYWLNVEIIDRPLPYEQEPNGSAAQATAVANTALEFFGQATNGDEDWFSITVPPGPGPWSFALAPDNGYGDCPGEMALSFFDRLGTQELAGALPCESLSPWASTGIRSLTPGLEYRVRLSSSVAGDGEYRLTPRFVPGPFEVEPNDELGAPSGPHQIGVPVNGQAGRVGTQYDFDWFAFDVPAGARIRAWTGDGQGGCPLDTSLIVRPPGGASIQDQDSGVELCSELGWEDDSRLDGVAAGQLLVRVSSADSPPLPYVLTVVTE